MLLTLAPLVSSAVINPYLTVPLVCPTEVAVSLTPIVVITSVLTNTILSITAGVTLSVTNAPICISTLTTATITSTASGKIQLGSPGSTPPQPPPSSIRVLWAQGDAAFKLNITAPDGSLITNGQTDQTPSPYLIHYGCDGIQGPQYGPWGQEGTGQTL